MTGTRRRIGERGHDLIREPLLNKGAAFSPEERHAFGLEGLLPWRSIPIELQRRRVLANLDVITDPLQKYVSLAALQDRNEYLYFDVLMHRLEELLPIVYTPTVGLATQRFSHVFQRGRGVWITPDMQGRVATVLRQAAGGRQVRLIVATDNESILGIGDQGAGGIAIAIGKLSIYTAAAGIDPAMVLPVSLDVGTDNEELRTDPLYLGWPERRLRGAAYQQLLDEFVTAVTAVFPGALVQWEDLRKDNALQVLDRYRERLPSFNDDIQGTGAVALAGMLTAGRITGRRLVDERVVILGGGAAGLGIARQIRAGLQAEGGADAGDVPRIAVLDSKGLIVADADMDAYKRELAWDPRTAARIGLERGRRTLADVVAAFRPTVLIGTSGQPGAFSREIVMRMAAEVPRPVILPLSNPTANCEALPADLYAWTDGRALVATGSPFPDVEVAGVRRRVGQGNNAFIFPGVGLAALAGNLERIDDRAFTTAARALAASVTEADLASGLLYPQANRLRLAAREVATAVLRDLLGDKDAEGMPVAERVAATMWAPVYPTFESR